MSKNRSFPGLRGIGAAISRITKPAFKRRGFSQGDIITRWSSLVGEMLANVSRPERLRFPQSDGPATLHIRVTSAFAPELQHLAPLVIERINSFYGYRAIGSIRLIQGSVQTNESKPLVPIAAAISLPELPEVDDPELRAALEQLGGSLKIRKNIK